MDEEWGVRLRTILTSGIEGAQRQLALCPGNMFQIGREYRTHINASLKHASNAHKSWEKRCMKLLSTTSNVLNEMHGISASVNGCALRCEMPTGDFHEASFRRSGVTLLFEAVFDNGYSVHCEPIGPLLEDGASEYAVSFSIKGPVDAWKVGGAQYDNATRSRIMATKIEWFLAEVAKRIPLYRLDVDTSKWDKDREQE